MRIRKNINCLTSDELHDLREAFAGIYALPESNPNSYARIAGLHGNPPPSYCIHSNSGFLSWHRAYLLEIENALRTIRCDVELPFWDWSSRDTTGVPSACRNPTYINRSGNTVPNPLYAGPIAPSAGGGTTTRRPDIDTTSFSDLGATARNAMTNTVWSTFVSELNGVHGSVHGRIGGDMGSVPLAAFDPIFHFHHCNVDRLWANWQQQNPITLPSSEANAILEPFTRPYTNTWHRGGDFENTQDWDYRYRNWCFWIPVWPWPLQLVHKTKVDDWLFDSNRIIIKATAPMMPMNSVNLRVFINDEKADIETKIEDNPNFAGVISMFGMGNSKMKRMSKEPYSSSLAIDKCLRKLLNKRNKEFSVKLVPVYPKGTKMMKMKMEQSFEISLEIQ